MSIHKLAPDRTKDSSTPFSVSVAFQHDLCELGEAVIKTRAIQAFDNAATRYPIHRNIRCAASNKLQDVFDNLALNSGLAPQRLDTGTLLLDGDGVFVSAEGYRKPGYCSCTFNLWAESKELADETRTMLLRVAGPCRVRDQMFVIDWQFCNSRGTLVSTSFDEIADDFLLDEAYPHLGAARNAIHRALLVCARDGADFVGPTRDGQDSAGSSDSRGDVPAKGGQRHGDVHGGQERVGRR